MGRTIDPTKSDGPTDPSRRTFLEEATKAAAVGLSAGIGLVQAQEDPVAPPTHGSEKTATPLNLSVNGRRYSRPVPDHHRLLQVLREDLGLTGTKEGCNMGQCAACTSSSPGRF